MYLQQKKILTGLALLAVALGACADETLPRSASTDGAGVYLIAPQDGETVAHTFKVKFGLSGMGIAPAGVERAGTGHHHLLIDVDTPPDLGKPLPATDQIRHFGGGQTEAVLTLVPGVHTLQLLLADYLHIPHQPPLRSEKITVRVLPAASDAKD